MNDDATSAGPEGVNLNRPACFVSDLSRTSGEGLKRKYRRGCSMKLRSKEHYEIMAAFEKAFPYDRKDKEDKELWKKGNIYQDGNVNKLFLAFRYGVLYGLSIGIN